MNHDEVKSLFFSAVHSTAASISDYAVNPDKDFTRNRKLPPEKLIPFLVAEGSSGTKNELLDFFGLDVAAPTNPAFVKQRAKLLPSALEAVFHQFNSLTDSIDKTTGYRLLAADGSTATFLSRPGLASDAYFVAPGHSAKGFYSIHINALYDLTRHTYTDAFLQPVHEKDEFRAFCTMVDRQTILPDSKNIYIGDRGYCSYNNMAHVIKSGQYFIFRTKDILSKGLVANFVFPKDDSFDITVDVTLSRSHSSKIKVDKGCYHRFIDQDSSFDFIKHGSLDTYTLSFRIVRFPISDDTFECLVTNLPREDFPPKRLKCLYFARWDIETSFRKLKYTIGLNNFHACKVDFVKQEIWARLITYNFTELIVHQAVVEKNDTKHSYKVNFTVAAHICRVFLRPNTQEHLIDLTALLQKELIPIRNERQFPRLQTAHFRKPRYFTYRAA